MIGSILLIVICVVAFVVWWIFFKTIPLGQVNFLFLCCLAFGLMWGVLGVVNELHEPERQAKIQRMKSYKDKVRFAVEVDDNSDTTYTVERYCFNEEDPLFSDGWTKIRSEIETFDKAVEIRDSILSS